MRPSAFTIFGLLLLTFSLFSCEKKKNTENAASPEAPKCTLGNTWKSVDTFQLNSSGAGVAIVQAPNGNLYSAHYAKTQSSPYRSGWVIRESSDSGETWSTKDTFIPYQNTGSQVPTGISTDSKNNIYVSGYTEDDTGKNLWTVRKYDVNSDSWSTVDDFKIGINYNAALAKSIRVDKSDNIYVAGELITNIGNKRKWLLKKSSDGGTSWSDIYSYQADLNYNTELFKFVLNPSIISSGILVGSGWDSNSTSYWTSAGTDFSGSISILDTYRTAGSSNATAHSAVFVNANTILVAGLATDLNSNNIVTIRRSNDAGASWSSVYNSTEYISGMQNSMAVGSDGKLYLGGYDPNALGWLIRKSDLENISFEISDSFVEGAANDGEMVKELLPLKDGSLIAIGSVSAPGNQSYSLTRKLSCK